MYHNDFVANSDSFNVDIYRFSVKITFIPGILLLRDNFIFVDIDFFLSASYGSYIYFSIWTMPIKLYYTGVSINRGIKVHYYGGLV